MNNPGKESIQQYWDEHIHDLAIATHPIGSPGFFQELAEYRYDKLAYLVELFTLPLFQAKRLLEVGCGVGLDLICLARSGSIVDGIDISPVAIDLAKKNFAYHDLQANLAVMDGEEMEYRDSTFDIVYAHGVLQYTADDNRMVAEILRVLKPGGQAVMMFYNKHSWLNALSGLTNVGLEHEDAPVLRKYTVKEVRKLLRKFTHVKIQPERFPVETRLHHGLKAWLYNNLFVKAFNILPEPWVRPLGWHLMVFASKP
jgi:ubiquinone/menaquinone biosynthesis C-methylase UbiE